MNDEVREGMLNALRGLLDMVTDNRTHGPEIDAAVKAIDAAESTVMEQITQLEV